MDGLEKASRMEMRRALELYALLSSELLRMKIRPKSRVAQKRIVEFEEELQQANQRLDLDRPPSKRDLRQDCAALTKRFKELE